MKNKIITTLLVCATAASCLAAPISQASPYHRHHWHRAGRSVNYRGCKKIVRQRFCRVNRYGERHCYAQRRVRFVC
jgi:hypothetical protein